MENSLNVLPTTPCIKTIGIKTMAKEIVIEIMDGVISFALLIEALNGSSPFSMCRVVFSSTTIESSTMKPMARIIAIKDKLSIV